MERGGLGETAMLASSDGLTVDGARHGLSRRRTQRPVLWSEIAGIEPHYDGGRWHVRLTLNTGETVLVSGVESEGDRLTAEFEAKVAQLGSRWDAAWPGDRLSISDLTQLRHLYRTTHPELDPYATRVGIQQVAGRWIRLAWTLVIAAAAIGCLFAVSNTVRRDVADHRTLNAYRAAQSCKSEGDPNLEAAAWCVFSDDGFEVGPDADGLRQIGIVVIEYDVLDSLGSPDSAEAFADFGSSTQVPAVLAADSKELSSVTMRPGSENVADVTVGSTVYRTEYDPLVQYTTDVISTGMTAASALFFAFWAARRALRRRGVVSTALFFGLWGLELTAFTCAAQRENAPSLSTTITPDCVVCAVVFVLATAGGAALALRRRRTS